MSNIYIYIGYAHYILFLLFNKIIKFFVQPEVV